MAEAADQALLRRVLLGLAEGTNASPSSLGTESAPSSQATGS
jgi:hypothetical protein